MEGWGIKKGFAKCDVMTMTRTVKFLFCSGTVALSCTVAIIWSGGVLAVLLWSVCDLAVIQKTSSRCAGMNWPSYLPDPSSIAFSWPGDASGAVLRSRTHLLMLSCVLIAVGCSKLQSSKSA